MKIKILFLLLVQILSLRAQKSAEAREREIAIGLLKNYDSHQRPTSDGSSSFTETGAVKVEINMYVRALGPLSTKDMELHTDITFRQKWVDPRLKYEGDIKVVTMLEGDILWTPDTFIRNEKEPSSFFLVPNKASYLRVFPNGTVLSSVRIKSKLYCLMDLRMFPFDQQECHLALASYSLNQDDIFYTWKTENPLISNKTPLPHFDFEVTSVRTEDDPVTTSTATYSCLKAVFSLSRMSAFYVTTQMTPLTMLVVTAVITVWMPQDKNNLKIGLNILLLLAASFKAENINNSLPFSYYTKAIDIYTGFTVLFIFAAFVVSAFFQQAPWEEGEEEEKRLRRFMSWSRSRKNTFIARATLTVSYIIFLILYWGYYGL